MSEPLHCSSRRRRAPFRPRCFCATAFQRPNLPSLFSLIGCRLYRHPRLSPQHPHPKPYRCSGSPHPGSAGQWQQPPHNGPRGASAPRRKPHRTTRPSVDSAGHGRDGPKSVGCGNIRRLLTLLITTIEARVSLATTTGDGLGLDLFGSWPGKHRGFAQDFGFPSTLRYTHSTKRAYRRARNRAQQSLEGGTMYRGQWHTRATLKAILNHPHPSPKPRRIALSGKEARSKQPVIRCLSWNASGLSSALFQEFTAWLDTEGCSDLVVLQETHWGPCSDFFSGDWACMHSSGHNTDVSFDKHGGILVMARKQAFQNMAFRVIYPGRLVHFRATHVKTGLVCDLVGIYQHVWRTHLPAEQNHIYRNDIWDKLSALLLGLPTRNPLLLAGDCNAVLQQKAPHVGPAATKAKATAGATADNALLRILREHNLCVLNSWNAKPHFTFESHQSKSQIDFVISRLKDSKGSAKQAHPLHGFPVGGWRQGGHWPVVVTLPITPFSRRPQATAKADVPFDKPALQAAVQTDSQAAAELRSTVEQRLQAVQVRGLLATRKCINDILNQCIRLHFPLRAKSDHRVSAQGAYRASARLTWQLYKEFKAPRVAVGLRVWQKWFEYARFRRASQALRTQSQQLKKAALLAKLAEAEHAATTGNQRVLHRIVRSLAPPSFHIVSRMRDPKGNLLSKTEELQRALTYAKEIFAKHPDKALVPPLLQDLEVTDATVQKELQKLGATKAVPQAAAPAAAWKLCHQGISQVLGPALRAHFQAGSGTHLMQELHDASITLIPKPNKPATDVANMRPIGLQCPSAKVVAGIIRHQLVAILDPWVRDKPQYAYTKRRGTFDALLRVHMHFEQTSQLLRANRIDRFQQHQGKQRLPLYGGMSLSLDLSKAFDLTDRPRLYQALAEFGVPQDTITIVQQLYKDARYIFRFGASEGSMIPTNGLKQGCIIAPFLWCFYTLALIQTLQQKRSEEWLLKTLTLFADDTWGSWLLQSREDFQTALSDITVILETLIEYRMEVNFSKTAVLLRVEGKKAKAVLYEHCCYKNGVRYLQVPVHGKLEMLPIKDTHEYLGTKVSYKHRLDKNLSHRVQAGQGKYQQLRKTLNGEHALSCKHRVRLWVACVQTSLLYSLPAVGITRDGMSKLTTVMTKHLRAIFKQPAHLTHSTNDSIWGRAGLTLPGPTILNAVHSFTDKLASKSLEEPDITTTPEIFTHLQHLATSITTTSTTISTQQSTPDASQASLDYPCPECAVPFSSDNARRIHCKLKHGYLPEHATSRPVKFQAHLHACGGLPQCQLCGRRFVRWQHLRVHIEDGSCDQLGGESFTKHPPRNPDAQVVDDVVVPAGATPDPHATGAQQNLPLLMRPEFLTQMGSWEGLLREPRLRADLQAHCTICHMWVADFRHVRQHITRIHEPEYPGIIAAALKHCETFKRQLTRDHDCPFCRRKVWSSGRHTKQCVVLFQICVAREYHKRQVGGGTPERHQSGGRHLCTLPPVPADQHGPTHGIAGHRQGSIQQEGEAGTGTPANAGGTDAAKGQGEGEKWQEQCSPAERMHAPPRPTVDPTRGSNGSPQSRQGIRAFCKTRPVLHHPGNVGHLPGVEPQAGGGSRRASVTTEDAAAGMSNQGAHAKDSEDGGHHGGSGQAQSGQLANPDGRMDLHEILPQNQEAHSQHGQTQHGPHRGYPPPHLPVADNAGRDHSQVLQHPPLEAAGGHRDPHASGSLPVGGKPQGGESMGGPRGLLQPGRTVSLATDWHLSEEGNTAANGGGQAGCQSAVRALNLKDAPLQSQRGDGAMCQGPGSSASPVPWQTRPFCPNRNASTLPPSPHLHLHHTLHPSPTHPPPCLPNFSFSNPGNHCYLNAFLYALVAAANATRSLGDLPVALQQLSGRKGVRAMQLMGYFMLGWPDPESQHDVAEVIDYLHHRLLPRSPGGSWQGRRQGMIGGLDRTPCVALTQCIPLPLPTRHNNDLQHLINEWHNQEYCQALCDAGQWVFLQLPRFQCRSGRIIKARQQYHLSPELQVPLFARDSSLEVLWLRYRLVAVIRHHGNSPSSGHYTTLIADTGGFAVYDDDKTVRIADSATCNKAGRDMYILVLALLARQPVSAAAPLPSGSVNPASSNGYAVAAVSATARGGVDRQPAVSPGETVGAPLSGHAHTAAAPRSPAASTQLCSATTTHDALHGKDAAESQQVSSSAPSECGLLRHGLREAQTEVGSATSEQGIRRYFSRSR